MMDKYPHIIVSDDEVLNLEHNRRVLVMKAIEKQKRQEDAAKLLGVSMRTLARDCKRYNFKTKLSKNQHATNTI